MKDVYSSVVVSVVGSPAVWASPLANLKILGARPLFAAGGASLTGWEEAVYDNQLPAVPLGLVGELPAELAPSSVHDGLGQLMVFNHIAGRQVLDTNDIILANDIRGQPERRTTQSAHVQLPFTYITARGIGFDETF